MYVSIITMQYYHMQYSARVLIIFPSYHPDGHHCSDVVYWRRGVKSAITLKTANIFGNIYNINNE